MFHLFILRAILVITCSNYLPPDLQRQLIIQAQFLQLLPLLSQLILRLHWLNHPLYLFVTLSLPLLYLHHGMFLQYFRLLIQLMRLIISLKLICRPGQSVHLPNHIPHRNLQQLAWSQLLLAAIVHEHQLRVYVRYGHWVHEIGLRY